jgi:hypothetical protein
METILRIHEVASISPIVDTFSIEYARAILKIETERKRTYKSIIHTGNSKDIWNIKL